MRRYTTVAVVALAAATFLSLLAEDFWLGDLSLQSLNTLPDCSEAVAVLTSPRHGIDTRCFRSVWCSSIFADQFKLPATRIANQIVPIAFGFEQHIGMTMRTADRK